MPYRTSLNLKSDEAYRLARELAKQTGEPLLFKGDDFRHTDITPAIG